MTDRTACPEFGSRSSQSPRRGFSLIELILTACVISILAMLTVSVAGRVRESANRVACSANMRNIGMATLLYVSDFRGRLPSVGTANNSGFAGNWGNISELAFLASYLGDLKANGSAAVTRQLRCPGIRNGNLLYCFTAGSPVDRVATMQRLTNTAQRLGIPGGLPSLWAEPCMMTTSWPGANFDNGCGHRKTRLAPGVGIPWGGNVALSDGSVIWAPYTGPTLDTTRVTYVTNGAVGPRGIPSCAVTALCDAVGKLDLVLHPGHNLIIGRFSVEFDGNYY